MIKMGPYRKSDFLEHFVPENLKSFGAFPLWRGMRFWFCKLPFARGSFKRGNTWEFVRGSGAVLDWLKGLFPVVKFNFKKHRNTSRVFPRLVRETNRNQLTQSELNVPPLHLTYFIISPLYMMSKPIAISLYLGALPSKANLLKSFLPNQCNR